MSQPRERAVNCFCGRETWNLDAMCSDRCRELLNKYGRKHQMSADWYKETPPYDAMNLAIDAWPYMAMPPDWAINFVSTCCRTPHGIHIVLHTILDRCSEMTTALLPPDYRDKINQGESLGILNYGGSGDDLPGDLFLAAISEEIETGECRMPCAVSQLDWEFISPIIIAGLVIASGLKEHKIPVLSEDGSRI